jgi:hypothetical protein
MENFGIVLMVGSVFALLFYMGYSWSDYVWRRKMEAGWQLLADRVLEDSTGPSDIIDAFGYEAMGQKRHVK